jgi:hypothetical protein
MNISGNPTSSDPLCTFAFSTTLTYYNKVIDQSFSKFKFLLIVCL